MFTVKAINGEALFTEWDLFNALERIGQRIVDQCAYDVGHEVRFIAVSPNQIRHFVSEHLDSLVQRVLEARQKPSPSYYAQEAVNAQREKIAQALERKISNTAV